LSRVSWLKSQQPCEESYDAYPTAGALALLSFLAASTVHGQTLGAVLTGSQEVPPNTNPGFGNATVTFNEARNQVNVTITVAGINSFRIHA
jgi:hypothetical protein